MKRDDEIEQFPVQKRQIYFGPEPEMNFFDVDEDPGEADFIRVDDLFQMESRSETSGENLTAQSACADSPVQPESRAETSEKIPSPQFTAEQPSAHKESPQKPPEASPEQPSNGENQPFQQKSPQENTPVCARWFTLFPKKKEIYIDSRLSRLLRRTLLLTSYRLEKPIETIRIRPQFIQWLMVLSSEEDIEALLREFRDALELQAQNLLTVRLRGLFLSDICIVQFDGKELSVNETIRAVNRYQGSRKKKGSQK